MRGGASNRSGNQPNKEKYVVSVGTEPHPPTTGNCSNYILWKLESLHTDCNLDDGKYEKLYWTNVWWEEQLTWARSVSVLVEEVCLRVGGFISCWAPIHPQSTLCPLLSFRYNELLSILQNGADSSKWIIKLLCQQCQQDTINNQQSSCECNCSPQLTLESKLGDREWFTWMGNWWWGYDGQGHSIIRYCRCSALLHVCTLRTSWLTLLKIHLSGVIFLQKMFNYDKLN